MQHGVAEKVARVPEREKGKLSRQGVVEEVMPSIITPCVLPRILDDCPAPTASSRLPT
jgi:hypothetical protein